jgi:nucleotide-binding universal stress UspA family protein
VEESVKGMLENKRKGIPTEGFTIETAVEHGKPADRIVECAEKEGMDLVIIGNIGIGTKLSRMIKTLGSVSRTVSEKASCPVMIMH